MKNTFLVLSLLIALNSYCQKEQIVSESKPTQTFYKNLDDKLDKLNLEDFRNSNGNTIRIWRQNKVLTFGENATLTLYATQGENTFSETYTFKKNYNLDSLQKEISTPKFLEDKPTKIDEFPITLEISTSEEYQLVSTYGNEALEEFIADINKKHELKSLSDRFINELPRGNYRMGMSTISVDRLIEDSEEKSEFYKEVIQSAENKLQLDEKTPVTQFPLVIINENPGNFRTLNSLDSAKVESYKILPKTATTTAIYGNKGKNGAILVTTK